MVDLGEQYRRFMSFVEQNRYPEWWLARPPEERPRWGDAIDDVGLMLVEQPVHYGYDATPLNAMTFAHIGVDGIHFSILMVNGEPGPVVSTVPMEIDEPNLILGRDLFDFLALGCRCGYDMLPDLANHPHEVANEIESTTEESSPLLKDLQQALGLSPWDEVLPKLIKLQDQYAHLIEMSEQD